MPLGKQEMELSEVNRMLDKVIIEPSSSPCASSIVLVMKKIAALGAVLIIEAAFLKLMESLHDTFL